MIKRVFIQDTVTPMHFLVNISKGHIKLSPVTECTAVSTETLQTRRVNGKGPGSVPGPSFYIPAAITAAPTTPE